jgi:zinc transporter ZupT
MDFIAIGILFFSVIILSLIFAFVKLNEKINNVLLYFSGAFLLSLAFVQIVPEIFQGEHNEHLGYFVLLGFFVQIVIEYFTGGVDHGHSHELDHDHEKGVVAKKLSPLALLIGIGVHSFFEGMPFSGHFHHHGVEDMLLIGIVIHNIPITIVLMSLFLSAGYSKIKSFYFLFWFALAAPLGSVFSYFGGTLINDIELYYKVIMAFVVGIFFHIATVILYEGDKSHKFNFYKFLIIIFGVLLAILLGNLHQH